jgi:DNA-binding CsgD family transcriptional regulator
MDDNGGRAERLEILTTREREVLDLICRGMDDKAVAATLVVSPRTVLFHKTNIYHKLGLTDLGRAPRQRELGRFCDALSRLRTEPSSADGFTPDTGDRSDVPASPDAESLRAAGAADPPAEQTAPDTATRADTITSAGRRGEIVAAFRARGWYRSWRRALLFLLAVTAAAIVGAALASLWHWSNSETRVAQIDPTPTVTGTHQAGIALTFVQQLETAQFPSAQPPGSVGYEFRLAGAEDSVEPGIPEVRSIEGRTIPVNWQRAGPARLIVFFDAGAPAGRYTLTLHSADGRGASVEFEHSK